MISKENVLILKQICSQKILEGKVERSVFVFVHIRDWRGKKNEIIFIQIMSKQKTRIILKYFEQLSEISLVKILSTGQYQILSCSVRKNNDRGNQFILINNTLHT